MKKQTIATPAEGQAQAVSGEWLYLAPEGITIRKIADSIREEAELWEEAGVLEVSMGEKRSFDVECASVNPKDTLTQNFMAANGCANVFLITFAPESYPQAREVMKQILGQCGGLFCGDTQDFSPVIRSDEE